MQSKLATTVVTVSLWPSAGSVLKKARVKHPGGDVSKQNAGRDCPKTRSKSL